MPLFQYFFYFLKCDNSSRYFWIIFLNDSGFLIYPVVDGMNEVYHYFYAGLLVFIGKKLNLG
ncbi:MAG: hypothetical protein A3H52_00110 [Candidatus Zambryskibacteria bacterium RIFCSPLOWO2_02_FULL_39_26]|uniref:Uncharacterized protein n=1 Tax=Candidatus Zambryskibacteria bacterium RIFCSPLOWO2_12_FULL_39_23 TaxID=1802776 RepID=A0A1G2USD5_9BACT|nr:MAG: hypothetical protein A2W51_01955 [Candidatus Zambryskibacteria bacterium RIFCSPHIGHO2_02_39_10]OHB10172.1 MAG: hypothetical protein A3H52_00110 [Candidatus Zambryskibacteria bacterium RIFCSPLOWO2_02_FULL_39_26]OHB12313.1 MAG: hypothetical protein A3G99_00370 [Candidatus Zambryskibacteria bacterium RIFCSPLOWO2_12_FULL_39_23]